MKTKESDITRDAFILGVRWVYAYVLQASVSSRILNRACKWFNKKETK